MGPLPAGLTDLELLFSRIISLFVAICFIALVIMLTWGGVRFLTSGGDKNALNSATQTITWALLGMLFLIIAWLVLLLIKAFTGVNVTTVDFRTLF